MSELWVVNASPLIALAKAGHLDLLKQLATIVIPDAVRCELMAGPSNDAARLAMENSWGQLVSVAQIPAEVLEWGLGAGESQAVAAALERPGAIVVLDDAQARACAATLGLPLIGTLGVVVRAKLLGLLPAAAPVIADLQSAGLWVSQSTIKAILVACGETWPP